MIDIHCHILPAFDDGVQTMDEATALVRMEGSGGTKGFFATPHVMDKRDYDRLGEITDRACALREALANEGLKAEIIEGGEVYPTSAMLAAIDNHKPVTMAGHGKHMLVDLPLMALPHDFDDLLYELQVRGVTPILAHPERAAFFQNDPDRLLGYLERGIVCQVNAGSLSGRYGPRAIEVAQHILRRRWASFLASDSHRPPRRPLLGECARRLRPELGAEYITFMTETCPACVRDGLDLPSYKYETPPRPNFLDRLFRRQKN